MIRLLRAEVTIPTWALFLALLVVSAVAVCASGRMVADRTSVGSITASRAAGKSRSASISRNTAL